MKFKRKTVMTLVVTALFVILVLGSSTIFMTQMRKMVQSTTRNTVNEIATHDRLSIENFLERNWEVLEGIYKRLVAYDCDSIPKLQEQMSLERSTCGFHTLYLITEDGSVYNDRYNIYTREQMDIQSYLGDGLGRVACRYDYVLSTLEQKEMLLYAISLDGFRVGGVTFRYLVGLSPINQIQDHMAIYSFYKEGNSRGCTSVIDPNGDYIVNTERTVSVNKRSNLYTQLDRGTRDDDWTNELIRESMVRKETFQISYTDESGKAQFLFFVPVEGVTWYLVAAVEQSVFTELSQTFIFSSGAMVVIAIVLSVCMLLLLMRSQRNAVAATAAAQARSEFLSNMSHEIRTPLNGITGLLHLIETHLGDGNEAQILAWVQKANGTAQYLLSLISDILDMSKIQAEKLTINPEPFLLSETLEAIESMQRGNAGNRGIELILEQDITVPCIRSDETRIKQVLMNIVGNAVKFTPSGGSIRISAHQDMEEDGRVVTTISCADTGIGMTPEFQKQIWDSFTQEHNKVSNGMRGTGLGMSISKGIMDAMGGRIWVESELGKGSTFTIAFPSEPAEMPGGMLTEKMAAEVRSVPFKLLVAEDNELNAEILMEILHDEGYEAVLATDGGSAVELFSQSAEGEFDAILMDMQMPVMDGCQATRTIRGLDRADAAHITIFACTANSFQEDKERALESGMNDFLTKPIDIDQLLAKLTEQQKRKAEEK